MKSAVLVQDILASLSLSYRAVPDAVLGSYKLDRAVFPSWGSLLEHWMLGGAAGAPSFERWPVQILDPIALQLESQKNMHIWDSLEFAKLRLSMLEEKLAPTPVAFATSALNLEDDRIFVQKDATPETVFGNSGNDTITGYKSDDTLNGGSGSDHLLGESGKDTLEGGTGNDSLEGGKGDDSLRGGKGADSLVGGKGDDTIYGDSGDDVIDGGKGKDTLHGGDGDDFIFGGRDDDLLCGGKDDDTLDGSDGDDRLEGHSGNDSLVGGRGDDTLLGTSGDDTLEGGAGEDLLTGGGGADVFIFVAATLDGAEDTITDLKSNDTIALSGFAALLAAVDPFDFLSDAFSTTEEGDGALRFDQLNLFIENIYDREADDFAAYVFDAITIA